MQNKIASRKDFEKRIYNNPITLLACIKEHLLNFQETRFEISIIADSIWVFFNAKQRKMKHSTNTPEDLKHAEM